MIIGLLNINGLFFFSWKILNLTLSFLSIVLGAIPILGDIKSLNDRIVSWLASLSLSELGTAQPQLFILYCAHFESKRNVNRVCQGRPNIV
jgi:hypothetical protein